MAAAEMLESSPPVYCQDLDEVQVACTSHPLRADVQYLS